MAGCIIWYLSIYCNSRVLMKNTNAFDLSIYHTNTINIFDDCWFNTYYNRNCHVIEKILIPSLYALLFNMGSNNCNNACDL